jgi:hypothetical protein
MSKNVHQLWAIYGLGVEIFEISPLAKGIEPNETVKKTVESFVVERRRCQNAESVPGFLEEMAYPILMIVTVMSS